MSRLEAILKGLGGDGNPIFYSLVFVCNPSQKRLKIDTYASKILSEKIYYAGKEGAKNI